MTNATGLSKHQKVILRSIIQKGQYLQDVKGERRVVYISKRKLRREVAKRYHIPYKKYYGQWQYRSRMAWEQSDDGKKYASFISSFSRSIKRLIDRGIIWINQNDSVTIDYDEIESLALAKDYYMQRDFNRFLKDIVKYYRRNG